MDMDDELPRSSTDPLAMLVKQDLDPFSVDELDGRIALLRKEIERCEARKKFAVSHRANADDLFRKG